MLIAIAKDIKDEKLELNNIIEHEKLYKDSKIYFLTKRESKKKKRNQKLNMEIGITSKKVMN